MAKLKTKSKTLDQSNLDSGFFGLLLMLAV